LRNSQANAVSPLLGDIKWNQGSPYNLQCPTVPTGYGISNEGEQSVTGCVATAMAQIMKYHEWPVQGNLSHSYIPSGWKNKGYTAPALSADFAQTTYNWANMTPTYNASSTQAQQDAVATLMYHCGVSVDMNYNVESGAVSAAVLIALRTYFDYDLGMNYVLRDFYSASEWKDLLKTELNVGRPVFYHGNSSGGGHAFVCDGYDSNDLFHMNWGWGGSSNGYFELSALNPSTLGIGGGSGGYNNGQGMLTGIRPNAGTPSSALVMELGYESFTVSVNAINIADGTFDLLANNVRNTANKPFEGNFGVAIYSESDVYIDDVTTFYFLRLPMGNYYPSLPFNGISLNGLGLSDGNYKLRLITIEDANGTQVIKYARSREGTNDYIGVTIAGPTATFYIPAEGLPNLSGNSLQIVGMSLYQNKLGQFSIDVTNSGTGEYNSNLAVVLLPSSGAGTPQANGTLFCNDPVIVAAGATTTIGFSATVGVTPGSYTAYVLYDPNNFRDAFDVAASSILASIPVTVNAEPTGTPTFTLTQAHEFTSTFRDRLEMKATIQNTGSTFVNIMRVYIFPATLGTSLTWFGSQYVEIAAGQTKEVVFTGSVDLAPGDYAALAYYYTGSALEQLNNPMDYRIKYFTLQDNAPTSVIEPIITDDDPVIAVQYFDLLGKVVKQPQKGAIYIVKQTHKSKNVSVKKIVGI
jgi:hypothetical protein